MHYLGSKIKIATKLTPFLMRGNVGKNYVEPFAGGMGMMMHIHQAWVKRRTANDSNPYVIAFWKAYMDGWRPPYLTREEYNECRKGNCDDALRAWAGFGCSFGGKWFGGYIGEMKTDYLTKNMDSCEKKAWGLQGVNFTYGCYSDMDIPAGSLVYCDPPYDDTTGYATVDFDHTYFWQWVRELSATCAVFVSEYTAPDDFLIVAEISMASTLSKTTRAATERLFTYAG